MAELYIGLMSGTSADGVDAVLVEFSKNTRSTPLSPGDFNIIASHSSDFSPALRDDVMALFTPGNNEIDRLGYTAAKLANTYATSVQALLENTQVKPTHVTAIGCHGQTIRHRPQPNIGFSLQIGDASRLASLTGIPVVHQFRQADIANGGEGAPLAPAFHHAAFASSHTARAIVNIGGISNVTLLMPNQLTRGWDTGPGNGLMDAWIFEHSGLRFDNHGQWAATGNTHEALLNRLLSHPYFAQEPPKSTGKEIFTPEWLHQSISSLGTSAPIEACDVQRTLLELTARTIANALLFPQDQAPSQDQRCPQDQASSQNQERIHEIYLCGGGAYNTLLVERLNSLCAHTTVLTTAALGIEPEWVEAAAFAWLAKQFWHRLPGNLPAVTGAKKPCILGQLVYP